MHSDKKKELLDTIFRLFPGAYIVSESELKPIKQIESAASMNLVPAKLAKPQRSVSRACKRKVFDNRQLSLFDNIQRGGT